MSSMALETRLKCAPMGMSPLQLKLLLRSTDKGLDHGVGHLSGLGARYKYRSTGGQPRFH